MPEFHIKNIWNFWKLNLDCGLDCGAFHDFLENISVSSDNCQLCSTDKDHGEQITVWTEENIQSESPAGVWERWLVCLTVCCVVTRNRVTE